MAKLSEAAKQALVSAPGYAQGTKIQVRGNVPAELAVGAELFGAGLIGMSNGLTRKGSILAEKLKSERERELFR